jgi:hypothetical protein
MVSIPGEAKKRTGKYVIEEEVFEKVAVPGFTNGFKRMYGINLYNGFRNASLCKNLKIKIDDIFMITFPKSGTTWTEVFDLIRSALFIFFCFIIRF